MRSIQRLSNRLRHDCARRTGARFIHDPGNGSAGGSEADRTGPSLRTGTVSDGLTGTFHGSEQWEWTGELAPIAPTSGHLGEVDADRTAVDVCSDDDYLIVTKYCFSEGWEHCATLRANIEVDGGEHGHLSLSLDAGRPTGSGTGDITG